MWKWLRTLFGTAADEATLRDDVAEELRRKRRDGSDSSALLMVPAVGDPGEGAAGSDSQAPGGGDGGGASDGGSCGASCGVA